MSEPNYNDGKWHGWNGGECPVHPESEVECICTSDSKPVDTWTTRLHAGRATWDSPSSGIRAFRVVKEHKEPVRPREYWILDDENEEAEIYSADPMDGRKVVHVREVLP